MNATQENLFIVITDAEAATTEFEPILRWLRSRYLVTRFRSFDNLVTALRNSASDPHAIVAFQTYKGQFDHVDGSTIQRLVPLTRLYLVYGSWSEGETRTGRPLQGFRRIGWLEFVTYFSSLDAADVQPTTVSDGERLFGELRRANRVTSTRIGVYSASFDHGLAIRHGLISLGYSTVERMGERCELRDSQGLDAIVWDDTGGCRSKRLDLPTLAEQCPGIPVIALMNAPRIQDVRRQRDHGVVAILGKPFRLADVVRCLRVACAKADESVSIRA